jgi:hypothetical protein
MNRSWEEELPFYTFRVCFLLMGLESMEQYGLSCEFDAPKEAFMAIRMQAGAPEGCAAVVRY